MQRKAAGMRVPADGWVAGAQTQYRRVKSPGMRDRHGHTGESK